MQQRHSDRRRYFTESANTSREYYIDYIKNFAPVESGSKVLEIGCGEGGNLLPFAEMGCQVTGIDRAEERITQAKSFFGSMKVEARFFAADFFEMKCADETDKYDIILIHDVIEHVDRKDKFFNHIKQFVAKDGIIFWGFPAWQMPFGGHQQICLSKICAKLPFIHLLPEPAYRRLLKLFGESKPCIDELIDIKRCGVSVEKFEKLSKRNNYMMIDRRLWLINPHYKQKFNLKPQRLRLLSRIRYLRNFFASACFFITKTR